MADRNAMIIFEKPENSLKEIKIAPYWGHQSKAAIVR